MNSLPKASSSAIVALSVFSIVGAVTAMTGCGSSRAETTAPAMQDSMKSDGMMKDGMMKDGMMMA